MADDIDASIRELDERLRRDIDCHARAHATGGAIGDRRAAWEIVQTMNRCFARADRERAALIRAAEEVAGG